MRYVFTHSFLHTTDVKDEYGSVVLRVGLVRPEGFIATVKSHTITTPSGEEVARVSEKPGGSLFSQVYLIERSDHGIASIRAHGWFQTRFEIMSDDGAALTLKLVRGPWGRKRYLLVRNGDTIATVLYRSRALGAADVDADIGDVEDLPLVVACMRAVWLLAPNRSR